MLNELDKMAKELNISRQAVIIMMLRRAQIRTLSCMEADEIRNLVRSPGTRNKYYKHTKFQGLYISEQELEELLEKPIGVLRWATAETPLSNDEIQCDRIARRLG